METQLCTHKWRGVKGQAIIIFMAQTHAETPAPPAYKSQGVSWADVLSYKTFWKACPNLASLVNQTRRKVDLGI